ncbi:MAG: dethiobiotin synthase [Crocinitomicaceae bacterium]|nr:dethiobiotin synthase [Crocinitomicaceae bacterium]
MKKYFVTGIGTDVGKTICAAILVKALKADYWKPVQAGSLEFTDTMKVKSLIPDGSVTFFPEQFRLNSALSPHAAAKIDGIEIKLSDFILPQTKSNLVIEGAGGLMVPLNDKGELVVDLIAHFNASAILVSQNYLGSINHTLLSVEALKSRGVEIAGIIFNGESNAESENIILSVSGLKCIGRVQQTSHIKPKFIDEESRKISLDI